MNSRITGLLVLLLAMVMTWGIGCAKPQPVSHFVIASAGGAEITDSDADVLRAVLDRVAEQYKMPKYKSGQAGIIRYYKPTSDYEIGFFAKREAGRMIVYAQPMTPTVADQDAFRAFRQNLANVLANAFPGRVALEY